MNFEDSHIPVMSKEVLEALRPQPKGCIVDGTVGLGGHTRELIRAMGALGRVIGIDRDADSLNIAQQRLKEYREQCTLIQGDFRNLDQILNQLGITNVDGILLDLGISSYQLSQPQRGFSFQQEGPLDMRMDQNSFISAYDLVNSLSEREISSILKTYGEERWHNRIARGVVRERQVKPIETTKDLAEIILKAIPFHDRRQKIHPATRTFQALRIAVNRELEALETALERVIPCLKSGGRLCVISFHSLEDRIVKEKFRLLAQKGLGRIISKKPLMSTDEEIQRNPRSRSARLRIVEKI